DVERVAVGIGCGCDLSADIGAGAAAGHERNDEADVTRGPSLWGRSLWGRSLWGRSLWGRSLWGRSVRGGRTGEPAGRQHGRGKKPGETAAGGHGPPSPSRPLRREGARLPARLDLFGRGYCRLSGRTTRNRAARRPATRCIPWDAAGELLLISLSPRRS